jgi:hypothetical protein
MSGAAAKGKAAAPVAGEQVYTTVQVVAATGASRRQLQFWDEHHVVSPRMEAHRRVYSELQLLQIRKIVMLRKAGVGLQQIRKSKLTMLPFVAVKRVTRPVLIGDVLVVRGRGL